MSFKGKLDRLRMLWPDKRRAAYIGWLDYGNLGDEAVFLAYKEAFRDYRFVHWTHTSRRLRAAERCFRLQTFHRCALGGSTLIFTRAFIDIVEATLRHYSERPLFCWGTGVKPPTVSAAFEARDYKGIVKRWITALEGFSFIGVRGEESKQLLQEHGLQKEVHVTGDSALYLAPTTYGHPVVPNLIGINFGWTQDLQWSDDRTLFAFMTHALQSLRREGFRLRLFPVNEADARVMADTARQAGVTFEWCEQWKSPSGFCRAAGDCEAFIGEKLHAVVLATMARTPTLMLEYQPKCREYMRSVDMEQYCRRTDNLQWHDLKLALQDALSGRERIISRLNERILSYKARLESTASLIRSGI